MTEIKYPVGVSETGVLLVDFGVTDEHSIAWLGEMHPGGSSDPIQDDTWHCGDGLCFHTEGLVLHLGWRDSWWGDLVSYDRD